MERRQFLAPADGAGRVRPFCTLQTTSPIVALETVDEYLCARTDDGTCWVIDQHGTIVTHFQRRVLFNPART